MTNRRRIFKPRFWLIMTMIIVVGTFCAMSSQAQMLRLQNEELARLESQRDALREEKLVLERRLEFTYTDEFIIREAREKLDMLMPGEILFDDAE